MAMDSRTQFLLQLLDKLGAPLIGAVAIHPSADTTGQKDGLVIKTLSQIGNWKKCLLI